MDFVKQIERINKMHQLISTEKTGTPDDFSKKLGLGRSQMYNELDLLRSLDAIPKYCKKRKSFYYENPFDLKLHYSLVVILNDEEKKIFGGFNFRPVFWAENWFFTNKRRQ